MTATMMRYNLLKFKMKMQASYMLNKYKFRHWFFKWNQDEDGDIVFSVCNMLHFIKYKEHTVCKFGRKQYEQAFKYYIQDK